jgi:hypothetical protein
MTIAARLGAAAMATKINTAIAILIRSAYHTGGVKLEPSLMLKI